MSEEFSVNIGLKQRSALSPLMFIMVMELVSRKVSLRGSMGRMLYADDLVVVVESGQEMQEVLGEWKEAFGNHGLKMSMEKTEVTWARQQRMVELRHRRRPFAPSCLHYTNTGFNQSIDTSSLRVQHFGCYTGTHFTNLGRMTG